jgi:glycosyltransferase involved in cell wall biosynthesis
MIACTSKNDRATLLFDELKKVRPDIVDLGSIQPSKPVKLLGMISSISINKSNLRNDFHFSPVVANDLERTSVKRLKKIPGVTHIVQWGATSFPEHPNQAVRSYSVVTDGPYDPEDSSYPSEWIPGRWKEEFFSRQRRIYSKARFIFALSEWGRQKLIKVHGLDPDRVIRIGWGPMFYARRKTEIGQNGRQFVSIGNGWQRKGMDVVANAARLLNRRSPGASVVIGGKPFGMEVESGNGVVSIPRGLSRSEVMELIENSRAIIVTSRFDPSPHIILEALQLGTPIVATNLCGMPEVVRPPAGGRVVEANDPEGLAFALEDVLAGDEREQRRMAYEEYCQLGGWRRAAEIMSSALDTL